MQFSQNRETHQAKHGVFPIDIAAARWLTSWKSRVAGRSDPTKSRTLMVVCVSRHRVSGTKIMHSRGNDDVEILTRKTKRSKQTLGSECRHLYLDMPSLQHLTSGSPLAETTSYLLYNIIDICSHHYCHHPSDFSVPVSNASSSMSPREGQLSGARSRCALQDTDPRRHNASYFIAIIISGILARLHSTPMYSNLLDWKVISSHGLSSTSSLLLDFPVVCEAAERRPDTSRPDAKLDEAIAGYKPCQVSAVLGIAWGLEAVESRTSQGSPRLAETLSTLEPALYSDLLPPLA